jgi:hypothetical protein
MQRASRSADRGRFNLALKHYRKALQMVSDSHLSEDNRKEVANEIEERMKQLEGLN